MHPVIAFVTHPYFVTADFNLNSKYFMTITNLWVSVHLVNASILSLLYHPSKKSNILLLGVFETNVDTEMCPFSVQTNRSYLNHMIVFTEHLKFLSFFTAVP